VRAALALCHTRGKFLFEARPDLFPDFLTTTELELWGLFYEDLKKGQRKWPTLKKPLL
jgi:hypothetical protein